MTMAMSHSSRPADAGLDMAMVTVTGPAHELPVEMTPLMWPWPRASGWRGAGAGDPGGEGVPGARVALVGPGASGPAGDVAGVVGVRLAGVPTGGEVRVAGAGTGAGARRRLYPSCPGLRMRLCRVRQRRPRRRRWQRVSSEGRSAC